MTSTFQAPFQNETWIVDGKPVQQLFDLIESLAAKNAIMEQGLIALRPFSALAELQTTVPNPEEGFVALIDGTGTVRFKGGIWVLTSDDTTPA